jgi:hypothetical protein
MVNWKHHVPTPLTSVQTVAVASKKTCDRPRCRVSHFKTQATDQCTTTRPSITTFDTTTLQRSLCAYSIAASIPTAVISKAERLVPSPSSSIAKGLTFALSTQREPSLNSATLVEVSGMMSSISGGAIAMRAL